MSTTLTVTGIPKPLNDFQNSKSVKTGLPSSWDKKNRCRNDIIKFIYSLNLIQAMKYSSKGPDNWRCGANKHRKPYKLGAYNLYI